MLGRNHYIKREKEWKGKKVKLLRIALCFTVPIMIYPCGFIDVSKTSEHAAAAAVGRIR